MLLSLGLFFNLFISALLLPKYSTKIYLKLTIIILIIT
jgi:hypothetical protein